MTGSNWQCPFCGQHTTVWQKHYQVDRSHIRVLSKLGGQALTLIYISCANKECKELSIRVGLGEYESKQTGDTWYGAFTQSWQLRPEANIKTFPDYVPATILEDYREACLIMDRSPKASATMSRRCLQGMIRDFWGVKAGNLGEEIKAIGDRIDPITWKAIDAVREIGNIGAHMEKDVNLVIDVEPGEAEALIQLVETLIESWYVEREERKARMAKVIDAAAAKKVARARLKAAPAPPQITAGSDSADSSSEE